MSDELCLVYTMRDQRFNEFSDTVINFEPEDLGLADRMLQVHGGFGDCCMPMSQENASASRKIVDEFAELSLALAIAGVSARKILEGKNPRKKRLRVVCSKIV